MTYTSKEIISLARQLSQTQNSLAFSFQLLVHLLNNVYSQLYNDLTTSMAFTNEFTFTGKEADLPSDCYKIISVYSKGSLSEIYLNRSSNGINISGQYTIENNQIKINNVNGGSYTVKYTTLPVTLTAPEDPEVLQLDLNTDTTPIIYKDLINKDTKIWYLNTDGDYHIYSIENKTDVTTTTTKSSVDTFYNKSITITYTDGYVSSVTWDDEDITDYFVLDEAYPTKIIHDNVRLIMLYDDNRVYGMSSDFNKYEINPFLSNGQYFQVDDVFSIYSDDLIGKYLLVGDSETQFLCSYVPDTVLNYPESTFFDVLIDRLAIQLQALNGLKNEALETKLTNDEIAFYASINRGTQGIRMKNSDSNNRRLWI